VINYPCANSVQHKRREAIQKLFIHQDDLINLIEFGTIIYSRSWQLFNRLSIFNLMINRNIILVICNLTLVARLLSSQNIYSLKLCLMDWVRIFSSNELFCLWLYSCMIRTVQIIVRLYYLSFWESGRRLLWCSLPEENLYLDIEKYEQYESPRWIVGKIVVVCFDLYNNHRNGIRIHEEIVY
jgi:hypothetical protein